MRINSLTVSSSTSAIECMQNMQSVQYCSIIDSHLYKYDLSSMELIQASIYSTASRQQRPRSDCADEQSDLGLRCPYMSVTPFPMSRFNYI